MPVSTSRRRRWNNIMILGIIAFIMLLNLPTIIKTYLLSPDQDTEISTNPYLLNPSSQVKAMHFSDWSVEQVNGDWRLTAQSHLSPQELIGRWTGLVGTPVDQATFDSLKSQLMSPQTIEVWYVDQIEPQRVTLYVLPQFWLLKNWQERWIAVSVAPEYLLP
ncbi:hypothetical protein [Vibrio ostreicida]|uniref:hypothetical protein n=1 Tax=Vibrio ostreicida TaxID=526588 RepID=UPI0009713B39|nr:hypothetical protein [Vibrio ostreicida]